MDASLNLLGVIPARGGSKRIPHKNIRNFRGKPLISWVIETAVSANVFSRIVVTTDDVGIARIAEDCGAEVPFLREPALADDTTGIAPVIANAVARLGLGTSNETFICCLLPTAVAATSQDLVESFEVLQAADFCGYCSAVTRFSHPVQRGFTLDRDSKVRPIDPKSMSMRSQDLPEAWHDAGQFYWASTAVWMSKREILPNSIGYALPTWRVQDIDTEEDWKRAEIAHRLNEELALIDQSE